MGFFDSLRNKISGEFVDIIEWLNDRNDVIVHRFERYQNEIKNGAKLIVREGQIAVFINEGKLADVFEPGTYTLDTANLPILSTLKGWEYGFNSPFKAEVYFVNTILFTNQKWGTKNPITLNDSRFGFVEIRAFGTYAFTVKYPDKFITQIVGTDSNFTNDEINEHLRSLISAKFTDAVGEANLPIEMYAANSDELSQTCKTNMQEEFDDVGIALEKFYVENVSMPEELKKEIFEYSRINSLDLDKLAKFRAANAIEKAAENQSGAAGAGIGMGMGYTMAQQMGNMFNPNVNNTPNSNQQNPPPVAGTPPPIPKQESYFYAVDGNQQGPVTLAQLQTLLQENKISRDTLLWKEGMSGWSPMHAVPECKIFLGTVPPPLPGL